MKPRFTGTLRVTSLGILTLLLVGVPLWLVVVNSLKTQPEAAELGVGLPTQWAGLDNYASVFTKSNYLGSLANSLLITGSSVAILLAVGAPAAWAFARSQSKALGMLYWVSLAGVLLPLPVVPLVYLMQQVGLQGTQVGLIIFTVGSRISIVIFLMTGFAKALPRELEEAAAMDGAGKLRIFLSVVLPLMKPVMATTFIILVALIWNDFFGPLFLLARPDQATLPLGLYRLSSGIAQATAWNYVFAHVIMVSLPLILVYAATQKRIVEGVTAGALRG